MHALCSVLVALGMLRHSAWWERLVHLRAARKQTGRKRWSPISSLRAHPSDLNSFNQVLPLLDSVFPAPGYREAEYLVLKILGEGWEGRAV